MFKIFYLFDVLVSLLAVFFGLKPFFITLFLILLISFVMRSNERVITIYPNSRKVTYFGSLILYLLLILLYIIIFKKISFYLLIPLIDIVIKNIILNRIKYITNKVYFLSEKEIEKIRFSKKSYDSVKRVLDVFLSIVILIISSSVIFIIHLLILLYDGKPSIIKQKRVGINGEEFCMYKFRTYKLDGETKTKIGKIIRPIRFDELPQFFNVLKGDMSIVGPRPELMFFHKMANENIPYYHWRINIKPGLTGWAQINYKYTQTVEEYIVKTKYDLYYLKNRSFCLDFKTFMKTPYAIVYTLMSKKGN